MKDADAKQEIMDAATGGKFSDPSLLRTALLCIADTRRVMDAVAARSRAA